ncbi:MAG: DUF2330 domain-containing protein [Thermoplasmata archaeon]|nr:MAG: DUF2330 domain-containing protein [Thermoplasmata archaeon]
MKKLIFLLPLLLVSYANADGVFLHHYYEDVYEPNQKAIIFFDNGNEKLILQVRYEGNVSDFGWIVPLPSVPDMEKVDAEIFYELSTLTSNENINFGDHSWKDGVSLIKQEQVGIYNVSIVNATNASLLIQWAEKHGYILPEGIDEAVQYYIEKKWCFALMKIDIEAYIKERIEWLSEIDGRIKTISDAEKYLTIDLINDISLKKSYNESIASKLGIENGYDYGGWKWLYHEYWGWKSYGELKTWMYFDVKYSIENEIWEKGYNEVMQKYEKHGIYAIDKYDLIDRICYRIYEDIKEGKLYSESIASSISYFGSSRYYYLVEKYNGRRNEIEENVIDTVKSKIGVEEIKYMMHRGDIQAIEFIFKSNKIVYPLRITSLNGKATEVLLYVFSDKESHPKNYEFSMEYSDWIAPEDVMNYTILSKFVYKKFYLTKLRAVIKPEKMNEDVEFYFSSVTQPDNTNTNTIYPVIAIVAILSFLIFMRFQGGHKIK